MEHPSLPSLRDDPWASPTVRYLTALVVVEAVALTVYVAVTGATVTSPRYVLYPFVWINVGVLAVLRTSLPSSPRRVHLVAGVAAAGYFLALTWFAGLFSLNLGILGVGHGHSHVSGLQVTVSAPGWGPRVAYAGSAVEATFVPYRVAGFLALSYLVYAALLAGLRGALPGVVGVASCVGCSLPLAGPTAAGVAGLLGATGLVNAATALSVDLSTAVFLVAVALLTFRPGVDS